MKDIDNPIDTHLLIQRRDMPTDAVYTVEYLDDAARQLNDSEKLKLSRRGYATNYVTLVIISFDDLRLRKIITVSKFAFMQTLTDEWKIVAPILPIRIKNAAGDSCILSSLDPPRNIRLVVETDAIDVAMHNIAKEMRKYNLHLDRSSIETQDTSS